MSSSFTVSLNERALLNALNRIMWAVDTEAKQQSALLANKGGFLNQHPDCVKFTFHEPSKEGEGDLELTACDSRFWLSTKLRYKDVDGSYKKRGFFLPGGRSDNGVEFSSVVMARVQNLCKGLEYYAQPINYSFLAEEDRDPSEQQPFATNITFTFDSSYVLAVFNKPRREHLYNATLPKHMFPWFPLITSREPMQHHEIVDWPGRDTVISKIVDYLRLCDKLIYDEKSAKQVIYDVYSIFSDCLLRCRLCLYEHDDQIKILAYDPAPSKQGNPPLSELRIRKTAA